MQTQFSYRDINLSNNIYIATKNTLCSRCKHPACADFAAMQCEDFTPSLKFKPPLRGFDQIRFNTFRCGKAWSRRLQKGSLIAIVNSKTDEIFCHAYVTEIYFGEKHQMADLHGKFNHTMLSLNVVDNIVETMLKRLKSTSGSMIYNSSESVSVIYLKVIDEKNKHFKFSSHEEYVSNMPI